MHRNWILFWKIVILAVHGPLKNGHQKEIS